MYIVDENDVQVDTSVMEKPEQDLAQEFIRPSDCVLELGARYGSVSCLTNAILDNKENHVVVEPDSRVWAALYKNRVTNQCDFRIIQGFVSQKRMVLTNLDCWYGGYGATSVVSDESDIPSYSLEEISSGVPPFTVLIADCEGFLEQFFNESGEALMKTLRLVIFEEDYPDKCNYENVRQYLRDHHFTECIRDHQNVWIRSLPAGN